MFCQEIKSTLKKALLNLSYFKYSTWVAQPLTLVKELLHFALMSVFRVQLMNINANAAQLRAEISFLSRRSEKMAETDRLNGRALSKFPVLEKREALTD